MVLLERAPESLRGGNSRHTRDLRYVHDRATPFVTGAYPEEEFWEDLLRVTGGETHLGLATLVIQESRTLPEWMERHGVRWQPPLRGTLHLSRTNLFFLGGGKALVNTYYDAARRVGVEVLYEATVRDLVETGSDGCAVVVDVGGVRRTLACGAVVVASGGFEANIPWLARYWGEAAHQFVIRGTPYNDGTVLAALLGRGARSVGEPRGVHAVAVDARSPRYDGGIVTRVDSIPFGIVVNRLGQRFADEGEDLWPRRYASWGALIAEQPGQTAYSVFDAKVWGCFIPSAYPPLRASSLEDLASLLGVDAAAFQATVHAYNRSVRPGERFRPGELDGCATSGLHPPKSHWALPVDQPPFYAYPLRPGITFTYLGLAVDERARVLTTAGRPLPHVYAAGECMAGNILSRGYLGGLGLTIGSVFGRIAGTEAARDARA